MWSDLDIPRFSASFTSQVPMIGLPRPWLRPALLLVSAALLASLIPGGPIENRDFSHIAVPILLVFNLFLTSLAFASVGLALALRQPGLMDRQAVRLGVLLVALGYATVYTVDLAGWFPVTPSGMGPLLRTVEWVGVVLALLLAAASLDVMRSSAPAPAPVSAESNCNSTVRLARWLGVVVAAIAVIAFATCSAFAAGC